MKRLVFTTIVLIIMYVISFFYEKKPEKEKQEETIIVRLLNNNKVEEINLEEYIVGVVACEMPASFHNEALKANAVAARTYALKKIGNNDYYDLINSTNNQCYITKEEMKNKWNNSYDKYYSKIKESVDNTKGEFLTYNDQIISAFYFSTSNGYTENSENVFGQKLEYLRSVPSEWDVTVSSYYKEIVLNVGEFLQKLGIMDNQITSIKLKSEFDSGRVNEIEINNIIFKGTTVRTLLSLRSTDFAITYDKENVTISTKGYGHGVGMSQYGANEMALQGYSYEEILKYYYQNIKINNVY